MQVQINGETQQRKEGETLEMLMDEFALLQKEGIAVAVNCEVVPKVKWPSHALKAYDAVDIVSPFQGG